MKLAIETGGKTIASRSTWIAAAAFAAVEIGLSYYDYKTGKISWENFRGGLKYIVAESAAGVAGGALGSTMGAAIGSIFGPIGALVGGVIGGVAGGVGAG